MSFSDEDLLKVDDVHARMGQALRSGLIDPADTTVNFYDYRVFEARLNAVQQAFPAHWMHAIAVKSNPLTKILSHATAAGFGLESASYEECLQAHVCEAPFIVWDSPVKTTSEVESVMAQSKPVYINANSLEEFTRLRAAIQNRSNEHISIGLRINPQMHSSAQSSMQVGGMHSKFGEPISNAQAIIEALRDVKMPVGFHVHSSSQNIQTDETVASIKRVYDLAERIGWDHIAYFDLGGGYPVNYGFTPVEPMQSYAHKLKRAMPRLFDDDILVITEFGRYYHANAGWTASQIAEVKQQDGHQTIVQHAGADLFLRECYEPGKWPHRFFLYPPKDRSGAELNTDIGGPLCFGGDYLTKGLHFPPSSAEDWLLMLDTGANSYALWSKHCSRPFPKVIGYNSDNMFVIKDRQSSADAIALWS